MKKIVYILILFVNITFVKAQNNSGHAIYNIQFNTDPNFYANKQQGKKGLQMFRMLSSITKNFEFDLYFNQEVSLFKINDNLNTNEKLKNLALVLSKGKGVFYRDKKTILRQVEAYGDLFLINETHLDQKKWKLLPDKKTINGHTCFKATKYLPIDNKNQYKIEAWYTPDIPINHGPIGFGGLPGLIIKLKLSNVSEVSYILKSIDFNDNKHLTKIKKPNKGKYVTQKEFNEIGKKMMLRAKGL